MVCKKCKVRRSYRRLSSRTIGKMEPEIPPRLVQARLQEKHRWTPYGTDKCIVCKQQVHQDTKYCHTCTYSEVESAMRGKQIPDTRFYKQSNF